MTPLQAAREAAELSVAQLAERAGVPVAVVEQAEAGASPGLGLEGRISAALGEPQSQVFPRRWAGAAAQAARPGHQITPDQ